MSDDDERISGLAKIAGGLSNLINLLVDLDKRGALPRSGRQEKDGVMVEYSFGARTMSDSPRTSRDAPEAEIKRPAATPRSVKPSRLDVLEPVVDLFDEPDEVLVVVELPGVARRHVHCLREGDTLFLDARAEDRLYRKEIQIAAALADEPPKIRLHNGVLEVRLRKQV